MYYTRSLAAFLLLLTPCLAVSAQQRKITINHFKDEPVEIVSVKLDGLAIQPDRSFQTSAGWTGRLEIKIKNVSEYPVSSVEVSLSIESRSEQHKAATNSNYYFGNLPCGDKIELLQPGQTATLKHAGTFGDANYSGVAELALQSVVWNNDDSLIWTGGRILRRRPGSDPTEWEPISTPLAQYKFPKGFKRGLTILRAVDEEPPRTCNVKFEVWANKMCTSTNCNGAKCYVKIVHSDPAGCALPDCDNYHQAQTWGCSHGTCGGNCTGELSTVRQLACTVYGSPVLIDTLGNGYSLTDLAGGVFFNIASTGVRKVSWTAPDSDDAFLALDRNGNGTIDSGLELFGNATPQADSWAPNGFRALASLDANADGVVDRNDPVFAQLLLWRDSNHNGLSDAGELLSVALTDITAFETNYKTSKDVDGYGNLFRYRAKVRGKVTRWAWDVFFMTS